MFEGTAVMIPENSERPREGVVAGTGIRNGLSRTRRSGNEPQMAQMQWLAYPLIFSPNLQQIEEIGSARTNLDKVFIGLRLRLSNIGYL